MNCEMAAKSSIHWRIFASHLSGFLTMRTACSIFTNKLTTHLTSPGRNTTMVTNTGMKALMPKPTQPHTKTVVRIASSGMAESCGTPKPITSAATKVKPSMWMPYLTMVTEVAAVAGMPWRYM